MRRPDSSIVRVHSTSSTHFSLHVLVSTYAQSAVTNSNRASIYRSSPPPLKLTIPVWARVRSSPLTPAALNASLRRQLMILGFLRRLALALILALRMAARLSSSLSSCTAAATGAAFSSSDSLSARFCLCAYDEPGS